MECVNGGCVCAADPGWKLGKYESLYDATNNVWTRDIVQCPPGDKVCKKTTPGYPDQFWPPISCGSSCSTPYEEMQPLCERSA